MNMSHENGTAPTGASKRFKCRCANAPIPTHLDPCWAAWMVVNGQTSLTEEQDRYVTAVLQARSFSSGNEPPRPKGWNQPFGKPKQR